MLFPLLFIEIYNKKKKKIEVSIPEFRMPTGSYPLPLGRIFQSH